MPDKVGEENYKFSRKKDKCLFLDMEKTLPDQMQINIKH